MGVIGVPEEVREEDVLELLDEDGQTHEFHVLDVLMLGDRQYVICVPAEADTMVDRDEEEATEAFVFRMIEEDDETYLEEIEDEDEFKQVADTWRKKVSR